MAFALKVHEGDEHEQAANKKSHLSVPSPSSLNKGSQDNVKADGRKANPVARNI